MSFRGRLRLFFALIVIVPMVALGIVLFALTARSEIGKADAGIAAGSRAAMGIYREQVERARPPLRRLAGDRALQRAIASGERSAAERRLGELLGGAVVSAELRFKSGEGVASAGSARGVAAVGSEIVVPGGRSAVLSVSVTDASAFADRLKHLVARGGRPLASTLPDGAHPSAPSERGVTTLGIRGEDYRGKFVAIQAPAGPAVQLGVLSPSASFSERIAHNRVLIALLVGLFVLLAMISAGVVSRALTGQIATFLAAARRLSRGDFQLLVPLQGNDEFAELGREFNDMSAQLEAKMEELEHKRRELAETIRRVGDALATGLDRRGVVALAVRQAVDACDAEVGRALPLARGVFAERDVFAIRSGVGRELLGALEGDERTERTRRAMSAHGPGVHALSIGLRSLVDGPEYLGAISIARHGVAFSREEEDLLEYLAGQAVISIENASLHEAVEREAVTDELRSE